MSAVSGSPRQVVTSGSPKTTSRFNGEPKIHPGVESREHDVPAVANQVHDPGGRECIKHHRHHEQGETHLPAEWPRTGYLVPYEVVDALASSLLPGGPLLCRQIRIPQAVHHEAVDLGVGVGEPLRVLPLRRHVAHRDTVADERFAHQPPPGMPPAEDGERAPRREVFASDHESCLVLVPVSSLVGSNCIRRVTVVKVVDALRETVPVVDFQPQVIDTHMVFVHARSSGPQSARHGSGRSTGVREGC